MRSRLILLAVTLTLLVGLAANARADVFNALGRWLGMGWSEGYHAQDACCPGPVWAKRKGFSPPRQTYYPPPFTPYFESFPDTYQPPLQPTPALVPAPMPQPGYGR